MTSRRWYIWAAVLAGTVGLVWWRSLPPPTPATAGLPWQIERLAGGGTRVLGLEPGGSRLQEALDRFGTRIEVALFRGPDGALSAEAYYAEVELGPLVGRLILRLEPGPELLEELAGPGARAQRLPSGTLRYGVPLDRGPQLAQARIRALTFVPAGDVDPAVLARLFGAPGSDLAGPGQQRHWLWPERGLLITSDPKGKEVFHYVHPRDFSWVQGLLQAAGG
jgi:hypothetical protein